MGGFLKSLWFGAGLIGLASLPFYIARHIGVSWLMFLCGGLELLLWYAIPDEGVSINFGYVHGSPIMAAPFLWLGLLSIVLGLLMVIMGLIRRQPEGK